ncbi:hypothetical protein MTR_8g064580 [Medicago truncatula]|uniref:Uncharacterized protein n=1 Tax=Medicago truncatula TaxID=3880 RepID=A0A072TR70_MEDTR|nr:hypothetical protein MTR_8g064580 [Medicago truncatula]
MIGSNKVLNNGCDRDSFHDFDCHECCVEDCGCRGVNCCESASKLKKLEFWKLKIDGRFSEHGGRFWTLFYGLWFGKNRWPIWSIRWPILTAENKIETYFRA